MRIRNLHPWTTSPARATALQERLRPLLSLGGGPRRVRLVAGADVSFEEAGDVVAGVVLLSFPALDVVEESTVRRRARFPYVPGLLSFREAPPLLAAFARLRGRPDLVVMDGQGTAHPRRFGLACHMGLLLDIPTVGCAKSLLLGEYGPLGEARGSRSSLLHRGEVVGAALRTRDDVAPVYVSPGHLIGLAASCRWVLALCRGVRLPETTRRAHALVTRIARRNPA